MLRWWRVAAERVRSTDAELLVVAVDCIDMDPLGVSRAESVELYLVAKGFRGRPDI